jgi:excisionase family DNA binding protein
MEREDLLSTADVAKILGISRIAVYKKIINGEITAQRVGRGFVVRRQDILEIAGHVLGEQKKKSIEQSVAKTLSDYGEAIRKLGKE